VSRGFALPRAALLLGLAAVTLAAAAVVAVRFLRPHRPNVILLVADTLRADRLGAYGDDRGLTPFLDELAARGIVFRNAYAASSWTCPSVASLFTSRYPSQHHVTDLDSKLPESEVTLAERLGEGRYFTGFFSANFRLSKELGYGQGFNLFESLFSEDKVTADKVADDSYHWLDWAKNGWGHSLFLYYHFMETHSPYDPERESHDAAEAPLKQRLGVAGDGARAAAANALLVAHRWRELGAGDVSLLESLYDAEVALLDFRLRRLFAELERRRLLDHAIVVFTADHGEEFRDHGLLLHGTSLFNELIRVPLIVVLPGQHEGRVVDENVSLVDVAPTLLDLAGLPPEPRFEGHSLLGREHPDVLAEYVATSDPGDLARHSLAFVRGSVKLLVPRDPAQPEPVLYDLATDPFESRPDPPELAARKTADQEAAERAVAALGHRAAVAERGEVDERTRARLRALGYAN
jgi:choline-sulfatase